MHVEKCAGDRYIFKEFFFFYIHICILFFHKKEKKMYIIDRGIHFSKP